MCVQGPQSTMRERTAVGLLRAAVDIPASRMTASGRLRKFGAASGPTDYRPSKNESGHLRSFGIALNSSIKRRAAPQTAGNPAPTMIGEIR
jgi:hypothetical protein